VRRAHATEFRGKTNETRKMLLPIFLAFFQFALYAATNGLKMTEDCRKPFCNNQACVWPRRPCLKPKSSCSSSSSSSSQHDPCKPQLCSRQDFIYTFNTPKSSRTLIIAQCTETDYDAAKLEIYDMNRNVRIYTSRHPLSPIYLTSGQQKLKFVYLAEDPVTPETSLVENGCPCDSLRTVLTIGPFQVYWCSQRSPFFNTKIIQGIPEDGQEYETVNL